MVCNPLSKLRACINQYDVMSIQSILLQLLAEIRLVSGLLSDLRSMKKDNEGLSSYVEEQHLRKSGLMVINTSQVSQVLGISRRYAPEKVRKIKSDFGVPLEEQLTIEVFCKATGLRYSDVLRRIS